MRTLMLSVFVITQYATALINITILLYNNFMYLHNYYAIITYNTIHYAITKYNTIYFQCL